MELLLFSWALGKQCCVGKSSCWARNSPPGTSDVFHRHTAKQDKVENSRAGWVLGRGWGSSAANLGGQMQKGLWLLGKAQP